MALFKIHRLPIERRMELAGKLGRLGYLGGTKLIYYWKADHIPKETALTVLREATGLPESKLIEKIEPRDMWRY